MSYTPTRRQSGLLLFTCPFVYDASFIYLCRRRAAPYARFFVLPLYTRLFRSRRLPFATYSERYSLPPAQFHMFFCHRTPEPTVSPERRNAHVHGWRCIHA